MHRVRIQFRPQDFALRAGLEAAQARLALPDLGATARCMIGLTSIDFMSWSPVEAGEYTGRLTRDLILQRMAQEAGQCPVPRNSPSFVPA
jgi:hypothetical protein